MLLAALVAETLEPRGHILVGLDEQVNEVAHDVLVLVVEERGGQTYGNIQREQNKKG